LAYLSDLANILIRDRTSRRWSGWVVWFLIALFVLLANQCHASEWQSVLNTSDGIQIFEKESSASGLIEFRGNGVVEAPLPLVATVIFDTDRRREWIKGLAESRILRWEGKDDYIEYDHIDMPTFFADRDFVSRIQVHFDRPGKELVFHYQPSDDPSAPHTDYLRGEMLNMTFHLSSIEHDTKTRVDAEFLCDPKGWIPKWLVNFFLKDWPKITFRNLRKEVLRADISVDSRFADLLKAGDDQGK
jgi:hypothetical protein